jgi:MICOS complex subunit MIC19
VQARVASELKKLSGEAATVLHKATERATAVSDDEARQQEAAHASKQAVSKEVEALRARLEKRKQLRELPESVERARSAVVQCLIANDRRPLNCDDEVQAFKEEVRRLEKAWVDKVVR